MIGGQCQHGVDFPQRCEACVCEVEKRITAERLPVTHAEAQAWIDSLDQRSSEILADVVGEKEYRASIDMVEACAGAVAAVARQYADNGDPKSSRIARDIVTRLLAVQRDMMEAGAKLRVGAETQ